MRRVSEYADTELQTFIENHRKRKATDRPAYAEAMEEWHRRHGGRLEVTRSIAFLKQAAGKGECVTYGELAQANGCSWKEARYPMNTHLWVLVDYARQQGWPMLSAIVVNKTGKVAREMEPETLKGFIAAAKALRFSVVDEHQFLKDQQEDCFAWGRGEWPREGKEP